MSEPVTLSIPARFPSWQSEVQAAINETDAKKLLGRVHATLDSTPRGKDSLGKRFESCHSELIRMNNETKKRPLAGPLEQRLHRSQNVNFACN